MLLGGTEAPDPFAFAADVLDPPPDEDRALAQACATNLGTLIREAWPILEPATPFVDGWHVDVMAEHLEAVSAGELRRLIINIPPRAMKSLTTAVFWPAIALPRWTGTSSPRSKRARTYTGQRGADASGTPTPRGRPVTMTAPA
jgi:hypothetical protein